jgi:hypothetical protein
MSWMAKIGNRQHLPVSITNWTMDRPRKKGSTKRRKTTNDIRKRPANCILFVWTGFPFEFSSFSDGPAVLGV